MFIAVAANVQVISNTSFANQYITPLLPYFEILYYLCSFALLVVAIIGLRQFVLTKRIEKLTQRGTR